MVCSFWPRQVGSASPMPCSASPMPATLPWPKIAQTPSMKRSPSSVICTLSQRIIACAAVSRMVPLIGSPPLVSFGLTPPPPARSPAPCPRSRRAGRSAAPSRRPPRRRRAPPVIQRRATSPKIVRPTAKPLTRSKPAAVSKLAASSASGASRPSTTMPRVWRVVRLDRGDGVRPGGARGHRLELPPVGPDAGGVELADQRRGGVVVDRADLGRDDLEQELEPVAARGLPEPLHRRLLLGAHLGRVVRVAEAEHLDHVLARPFAQAAAVAAELGLQRQRPRARPFAGPADPEAGAGGGVQRRAAEPVVAEDAVAGAAVPHLERGLRGRAA